MIHKEIIIIFKNNVNSMDLFESGSYTLSFKNCSYTISGDHYVLEQHNGDNVEGYVFPLKSIINFKISKNVSN